MIPPNWRRAILAADLEPISFDDLPLGGEWTTRRRTISESEIALFAGVSGDFSPLTIDASEGNGRIAPPALLIGVAIGLGSVDMPVPSIAEWEWTNWKFPRQVRAGETVYARWTLTQKRPAMQGASRAIAVWRVDVHTADGAMCAEGEIGASVYRSARPVPPPTAAPATGAAAPSRRRRGRKSPAKAPAQVAEQAPKPPEPVLAASAAQAAAQPEKPAGSRRRRRRRPKSGSHGGNGQPAADSSPEPAPPPVEAVTAAPVPTPRGQAPSPLSRVIKRLRRPTGG